MKRLMGILGIFGFAWLAVAQPTTNLEQVVVTVNDQPILERDLRREALVKNFLYGDLAGLTPVGQPLACADFSRWSRLNFPSARVLIAYDHLRNVILENAVQNIEIPASEATSAFEELQEYIVKGETFRQGVPFDQYLQCTEQTEAQVRKNVLLDLRIKAKIQQIESTVTISSSELENFYQARQFRSIQPARIVARLMVLPSREKTTLVLNALQKGADFSSLARLHSVVGANKDGALGATANSTTPQPLAEKQLRELPKSLIEDGFALTRGGITRAIKSDTKWYILQVTRYFPPTPRTLEEIRPQLEKDALKFKARGLVEAWKKQAWEKATIRFTQPNFSPVVAKINGQNLAWHEMVNFYDLASDNNFVSYFRPFTEDFAAAYRNAVSQTVQQQSLEKLNVQGFGTRQDRLELFLSHLANKVIVTEAEAKAYYQAKLKFYQIPGRADITSFSFKTQKITQDFRKAALTQGDIPTPNASVMKLGGDGTFSAAFLQKMVRSPKNNQMYVSSVFPLVDGRWAVDVMFFPAPAHTRTFETVKDSIVQLLHIQKREGEQKRWIAKQITEAKMENLLSKALAELERRTTRW
jgi:parvulin-like peptidyl-prolyl isomerase